MRFPHLGRRASLIVTALGLFTLLTAPAPAGALVLPTSATSPWERPGPYTAASKGVEGTTFYYPGDIASSTRKHPVIIWGNGTFAFPFIYDGLFRHWASQGFIVAAANTPFSNTGNEMRAGIDLLEKANAKPGDAFYGKVDLARIGATGHSQGGAGAIQASADPRVSTTIALEPGPLADTSKLHGPTLYLAGQNDIIVFPFLVQALYNGTPQVPAVYVELAGAGHFTAIGDAGAFRGVTTAWFRFQLMNEQPIRQIFHGEGCGICSGPVWLNYKRNTKAATT